MRFAAVLILGLVTASTAQATGDIIWRVHCKFPGEKEKPLKRSFRSTSSECWESILATKLTFEALRQLIVDDYMKKGRKSARRLKAAWRHLGGHFATDRAVSITSDRIQKYEADRLSQGVMRATLNAELASLRRAFKLAVRLSGSL